MLRTSRARLLLGPSMVRLRSTSAQRRPLLVEQLEDRIVPSTADFSNLVVDPTTYDPDHILVRLLPGITDPAALQVVPGTTFESPLALVPGLWEVRLDGVSVEAALEAYRNNPFVMSATPNYQLSLSLTPDDPVYESQYPLNNTGQ